VAGAMEWLLLAYQMARVRLCLAGYRPHRPAAFWRLPRGARIDVAAVALLSGVSVFLWRISANMPQLNADGLPGFSADDWLAPVLTYVFLGAYAHLRPPADPRRFGQARALATIASLAVNVGTI
jgi:hypothetical protein